MKALLVVASILLVASSRTRRVVPDSEGIQRPYVIAVKDGWDPVLGDKSYYFKMSPEPSDTQNRDAGVGFAFEVQTGPTDKLLWKTAGWFAWQVFLARDGRHMIRLGGWPRGDKPKAEDLAIAFYDAGVLVKSYSTLDLIKDAAAVPKSVSHYQFLGSGRTAFVDDGDAKDALFRMSLADSTCVFRVSDGGLVSQR